jgi:hypothetical protein
MRHFDRLAEFEREGFEIIVDKTWEDMHPSDCFDDSVTDINQLCEQIDTGYYDWFMLRVRVLVDGHELASEYLGGCCYEDARDVLTDGVAEDIIWTAMNEAKQRAGSLSQKLFMLSLRHSHTVEV